MLGKVWQEISRFISRFISHSQIQKDELDFKMVKERWWCHHWRQFSKCSPLPLRSSSGLHDDCFASPCFSRPSADSPISPWLHLHWPLKVNENQSRNISHCSSFGCKSTQKISQDQESSLISWWSWSKSIWGNWRHGHEIQETTHWPAASKPKVHCWPEQPQELDFSLAWSLTLPRHWQQQTQHETSTSE